MGGGGINLQFVPVTVKYWYGKRSFEGLGHFVGC